MPRLDHAPLRPAAAPVQEQGPFWWLRWVPAFLIAILVVYLIYVVGHVAIVPVLASFSLAYVLNPIVEWFETRGFSRVLSALLALMLVVAMVALFLWFVLPDLWDQSVKATTAVIGNMNEKNASSMRQQLREFSPMLDRMMGYRLYRAVRTPNTLIEASQSWFAGGLTNFLQTASNLADLALIPFFVFYILVDFGQWRLRTEELIPPRFREPFSRLFDEVGRILQAYVLGQLLIAMIMGALYAVGFAIMGVPAWPGIAALAGFLNVIPYVGTFAGLLLAGGFTFAAGGGLWGVLGVAGIFTVVQLIEGYYLTPRILGDRLKLHPMEVFLGLLVGGKLFGFLGVLLAVPAIAVSSVFIKFGREIYKSSEFYRTREIGPEPPPAQVEDVLAKAADTVLSDQVDKQTGDEVMAPDIEEDDQAAREKVTS